MWCRFDGNVWLCNIRCVYVELLRSWFVVSWFEVLRDFNWLPGLYGSSLETWLLGDRFCTWTLIIWSVLWHIRCKPWTYLAPKLTLSPKWPNRDSIWHTSSRSSIGCVQIYFWAYVTFHANLHLSYIKINTISKQIKPSFHLSPFT